MQIRIGSDLTPLGSYGKISIIAELNRTVFSMKNRFQYIYVRVYIYMYVIKNIFPDNKPVLEEKVKKDILRENDTVKSPSFLLISILFFESTPRRLVPTPDRFLGVWIRLTPTRTQNQYDSVSILSRLMDPSLIFMFFFKSVNMFYENRHISYKHISSKISPNWIWKTCRGCRSTLMKNSLLEHKTKIRFLFTVNSLCSISLAKRIKESLLN